MNIALYWDRIGLGSGCNSQNHLNMVALLAELAFNGSMCHVAHGCDCYLYFPSPFVTATIIIVLSGMSGSEAGALILITTVNSLGRHQFVEAKRLTGEIQASPWLLRPGGQAKAEIIRHHAEALEGGPVRLCSPEGVIYSDSHIFKARGVARSRSRSR